MDLTQDQPNTNLALTPNLITGESQLPRRSALLGSMLVMGGASVPAASMAASGPRSLYTDLTSVIRREVLTNSLDISFSEILRLVLHDSLSGGVNGSIRFELQRPENEGLGAVVEKLEGLRKKLQEASGKDITFADTELLAGQVIACQNFKYDLQQKLADPQTIEVVYQAYGNKPKKLRIGRPDASGPGPEGLVPWKGSTADEVISAYRSKPLVLTIPDLCKLAPGLLGSLAEAEEVLKQKPEGRSAFEDIEKSKATVTRTAYEIGFFNAYTKVSLAAKIDESLYFK